VRSSSSGYLQAYTVRQKLLAGTSSPFDLLKLSWIDSQPLWLSDRLYKPFEAAAPEKRIQ
jgi:hypothetical protein